MASLVKSPTISKGCGGSLIFAKDHKTLDMFDPLARFGPHRRERLEKSWARLFREEILPELPVHKLRPFFSESKGAPTKDLYAMLWGSPGFVDTPKGKGIIPWEVCHAGRTKEVHEGIQG